MSLVDPRYVAHPTQILETPVFSDHQEKQHDVQDEPVTVPGRICVPAPYFRIKTYIERFAASILLLMSLPIMVLLSAVIAIFDGRPIFYRQSRVGKNGARFQIWKFRTMRQDAENATGPIWSSPNDKRVTWLGRWLRATHLDELPQLFNVVVGEMNLIGPRPERPEFVNEFVRDIPGYAQRHFVEPGITGLAQVKQGYDASISDVERKLKLDLLYIETAGPVQDAAILFLTVPYVARELVEVLQRKIGWQSKPMPELSTTHALQPSAEFAAILEAPIESQIYEEIQDQQKALIDVQKDTDPSIPPRPKLLTSRATTKVRIYNDD